MYLFGIGTDSDIAVTESVSMIRAATNSSLYELHDVQRLQLADIERLMAADASSAAVFVCHGSSIALLDVAGMPFLTGPDHAILAGKFVFAHACNSALHLGRDIVKSATIYFGFDAPISAPVDKNSLCYQGLRQIYIQILSFISTADMFDIIDLPRRCQDILNDIRSCAAVLQEAFDTEQGSVLDAEELISVGQFGRDAAIWVRDLGYALKADGAPDRASLW